MFGVGGNRIEVEKCLPSEWLQGPTECTRQRTHFPDRALDRYATARVFRGGWKIEEYMK